MSIFNDDVIDFDDSDLTFLDDEAIQDTEKNEKSEFIPRTESLPNISDEELVVSDRVFQKGVKFQASNNEQKFSELFKIT